MRLFESHHEFKLGRLTVFCGTNSSGKSTILKTILLLRQSQGIGEGDAITNGKIRFNGSQIDLGDYSTLVSHNNHDRNINIAITITDKLPLDVFKRILPALDIEFAQEDINEFLEYEISASLSFSRIKIAREALFRNHGEYSFESRGDIIDGLLEEATFYFTIKNITKPLMGVVFDASTDNNEYLYRMILPRKLFDLVGGSEIILPKSEMSQHVTLQLALRGLLPDKIIAQRTSSGDDVKDVTEKPWAVFALPYDIDEMVQDLHKALASVDYLGPLRSPAKRFYMVPSAFSGMDSSGDFLPYILRDQGQFMVVNIRPGDTKEVRETLSDALNTWLYYLRTGQIYVEGKVDHEISVTSTRNVLVEFKVRSPQGSEAHALADSGFGYSQALPIIVRGLLMAPGSTLIVEQPELHLNPALQVRIAEFFVAMSRAGKQVLIETHSEHIVNMIRVLAAEDSSSEIATMTKIFFIDSQDQRPIVHELSIGEDGSVSEWPESFFGEALSLTGRLLRAQKHHLKRTLMRS